MADTTERDDRFAYFDLLKIIGALLIVMVHCRDWIWDLVGLKISFASHPLLWSLINGIETRVEMFFVISGVLFAVAYERKIVDGMGFDYFFLKRMARIYPLVAITSIFMYAGNLLLHRYNDTMWKIVGTPKIMELVYDILFAGKTIFRTHNTNNGPIWYISVLLFCYVIAYVLTRVGHSRQTFLIFALPIVVGVAVKYNNISTAFFNPTTARGLIAFFIGVMLGKYFKITRGGLWKSSLPKLRLVALVVFCLACLLKLTPWYDWCVPDKYSFYGVVVYPSLILLLYDCSLLNRVCANRIVKWFGRISFDIYLWNLPICFTVYFSYIAGWWHPDLTSPGFFTLFFAVHFVVAALSYEFFERPVGNRLVKVIEDHRQILSSAP